MEERIGLEIKRVQLALRAVIDRELSGLGLTGPQYAALAMLEEEPGASSAELARRSFVSAQTMGGVVANLERAGLVERRAHRTHGRILETSPTPSGRRLLADAHRRVWEVEERMTSGLDADERRRLLGLLRRCAEAIDEGRRPVRAGVPEGPRPLPEDRSVRPT